jgi:hypothetical protein
MTLYTFLPAPDLYNPESTLKYLSYLTMLAIATLSAERTKSSKLTNSRTTTSSVNNLLNRYV